METADEEKKKRATSSWHLKSSEKARFDLCRIEQRSRSDVWTTAEGTERHRSEEKCVSRNMDDAKWKRTNLFKKSHLPHGSVQHCDTDAQEEATQDTEDTGGIDSSKADPPENEKGGGL
ncbi:UNVERIFIED_CONTAM: hypothetical protein HHA_449140 [Hammondia hammondi]|eukprot:XP_008881702.1 hypothetical protein HHA_449140 [Hammondia hammondi]